MRQRLQTVSNGSQDEFVLRKLFSDFDSDRNGTISEVELSALLAKLGVCDDNKYLCALMKKIDCNNDGRIEFSEFVYFVINDTYK